jgi:hypothetical protein
VDVAEAAFLVPNEAGSMPENAKGMDGILITVAGRKLENREVHVGTISSR